MSKLKDMIPKEIMDLGLEMFKTGEDEELIQISIRLFLNMSIVADKEFREAFWKYINDKGAEEVFQMIKDTFEEQKKVEALNDVDVDGLFKKATGQEDTFDANFDKNGHDILFGLSGEDDPDVEVHVIHVKDLQDAEEVTKIINQIMEKFRK